MNRGMQQRSVSGRPVSGRYEIGRHDALPQQRHCTLAGFFAETGCAIGTHEDYTQSSAETEGSKCFRLEGTRTADPASGATEPRRRQTLSPQLNDQL